MNHCRQRLLITALSIAMLIAGHVRPVASHTPSQDDASVGVRRALERLPDDGVFDYLAFRIESGTVHLAGYSFQGGLGTAAAMAVRRVPGVTDVISKIEPLPTSINDDRVRWDTFYRIYTDDFLSKYAPGGVYGVLWDIRDERRFPGMQPIGRYPIHIIVKNGRSMLLGVVDSALDRQLAEVRAREVLGTFEVENSLAVTR